MTGGTQPASRYLKEQTRASLHNYIPYHEQTHTAVSVWLQRQWRSIRDYRSSLRLLPMPVVPWGRQRVSMTHRFLAIPILALVLQSATGCSHAVGGNEAAPARAAIPVPSGLKTCEPGGPPASDTERTASMLRGRSLGCFQSSETAELRGSQKTYSVPLESAFAVEMPGGPYSAQDLDKLRSDVWEGWKNFEPLNQDTRADYDRRLNGLIERGPPKATSKPAGSLDPPVLVSLEQLGPGSFAVVTIRRRPISLNGEFFSATKADAAAVVLEHAKLVRFSIARELRSKSDVEAVREAIADWVYAVVSSP